MRITVTPTQIITLAAVAGLFCASIGGAQCQAFGRRGGRAVSSTRNASSGSSAGSIGSSNSAGSSSAAGSAGCPANGGTQTGATTATGTTTATTATGTTTIQSSLASGSTAQILARRSVAAYGASNAQTSSVLSAQRTAANQVPVQYTGPTLGAQGVYIGVLDANGQVLAQRAVSQLPVQASFTLPNAARFYGVRVVYANGTSATAYTPIR